ncbi:MAG: hypothetical protein Q4P66_08010 [Actinomycetaceae bacterium]|nr:hypothetical protein [Actinomycetaceae bacterium]
MYSFEQAVGLVRDQGTVAALLYEVAVQFPQLQSGVVEHVKADVVVLNYLASSAVDERVRLYALQRLALAGYGGGVGQQVGQGQQSGMGQPGAGSHFAVGQRPEVSRQPVMGQQVVQGQQPGMGQPGVVSQSSLFVGGGGASSSEFYSQPHMMQGEPQGGTPKKKKNRNTKWLIVTAVLVVVVLAATGGMLLLNRGKNNAGSTLRTKTQVKEPEVLKEADGKPKPIDYSAEPHPVKISEKGYRISGACEDAPIIALSNRAGHTIFYDVLGKKIKKLYEINAGGTVVCTKKKAVIYSGKKNKEMTLVDLTNGQSKKVKLRVQDEFKVGDYTTILFNGEVVVFQVERPVEGKKDDDRDRGIAGFDVTGKQIWMHRTKRLLLFGRGDLVHALVILGESANDGEDHMVVDIKTGKVLDEVESPDRHNNLQLYDDGYSKTEGNTITFFDTNAKQIGKVKDVKLSTVYSGEGVRDTYEQLETLLADMPSKNVHNGIVEFVGDNVIEYPLDSIDRLSYMLNDMKLSGISSLRCDTTTQTCFLNKDDSATGLDLDWPAEPVWDIEMDDFVTTKAGNFLIIHALEGEDKEIHIIGSSSR